MMFETSCVQVYMMMCMCVYCQDTQCMFVRKQLKTQLQSRKCMLWLSLASSLHACQCCSVFCVFCQNLHVFQNKYIYRTYNILSKLSELLNSMAIYQVIMKCQNCNSWSLSHGAILVLASSTLLHAVHEFVYVSIKLSLPYYLRVGSDCANYASYTCFLPVTGWVCES